MREIELYLDFSCPWSYLALVRLDDVCVRNGVTLVLRPVSIETVLATENPVLLENRFAPNPAKAAWQSRDLHRWAEFWGLRIDLGEDWPQNRDTAAAASLAALAAGKGLAFCRAAFRAGFAGQDINSPAILEQLAAEAGVDPRSVIDASLSAERMDEVRRNSLTLIERGGFGTPSMFLDDALYFGNDRVGLIEWTLGPVGDADFVMPGQHNTY